MISQKRFELTPDIFVPVPQALIYSMEEHILDRGCAVPHLCIRLFDRKEYFLLKAYYSIQELLGGFQSPSVLHTLVLGITQCYFCPLGVTEGTS